MRSLFQQTLTRLSHLSDEVISKLINGELNSMRALGVNAHLAKCWQCKARRRALERAALQVVEYRKYHIQPRLPLDPRPREVFLARLDQTLEEIGRESWRSRVFSRIRSISVANMNPVYASTLVIVAAVVLLVLIWQRNAPAVSAKVFLEQAVQAEAKQSNPATPGVIYQKIKIKMRSRTVERSLYRDAAHKRTPRAVALKPDEEQVRNELETAGVDWQQPLSAANFREWHDHLAEKTDAVETADPDILTLVTNTDSTAVRESSLSVRKADFHPVSRRILLRDSEEIEISETNYDVLSWDVVNAASLFDEPTPVKEAFLPPARQPLVNSRETELAVRYALHGIGADLGEPIDVQPGAQGSASVSVVGIVSSPERKQELLAALNGIPHVSAQLQTEEEAGARELRGPITRAVPKIVTVHSPIEKELLDHFGDPSAVENFSKRALALTEDLMAHAWALRQLSERYPAPGSTGEMALDPASRRLLQTMRRDHRHAMADETSELTALMLPVLQPMVDLPSEPTQKLPLFSGAQEVQRLTLELVSGSVSPSANESRTPAKAAGDLLVALHGLEITLEE